VGQAKRRHVLRYLAARESAGIIGTGPFDLDEALVKLDARLAKGCRWALAVAVELALTGQRPKCKACHGYRSLLAYVQASRSVLTVPTPGPCVFCDGTGHNTSATLPGPAWLRRKGHDKLGVGEARSFARGLEGSRDPWQTLSRWFTGSLARLYSPAVRSDESRLPAWLLGERRHAEQRRERARRSAGKAERAATRRQGVEDLIAGALTVARAATEIDPAEQFRLAVEAARLYAAGALGVAAGSARPDPATVERRVSALVELTADSERGEP
jgi:hypothetical protein